MMSGWRHPDLDSHDLQGKNADKMNMAAIGPSEGDHQGAETIWCLTRAVIKRKLMELTQAFGAAVHSAAHSEIAYAPTTMNESREVGFRHRRSF